MGSEDGFGGGAGSGECQGHYDECGYEKLLVNSETMGRVNQNWPPDCRPRDMGTAPSVAVSGPSVKAKAEIHLSPNLPYNCTARNNLARGLHVDTQPVKGASNFGGSAASLSDALIRSPGLPVARFAGGNSCRSNTTSFGA